jgi:hydrogenase/urease accessory protein HupE
MKLLCIKKIASPAGLALLILLCLPVAVAAHPIKGVGDFYSGMLHPLTALEFLLSWIALALFAGQQGRKTALLALAIFPSALVLGAILGTVVASPAWLPAMNLVLIPILGLAVVLAISFPTPATVILVALVGLLHGLANGAEITAPVSPWRFIPGLAIIAVLVLAYGIGLVRSAKKPWTRIAVRVAGSWITAAGIMVCALKL